MRNAMRSIMVVLTVLAASACTIESDGDIFSAAQKGSVKAVERALKGEVDVNAVNDAGKSALLIACEYDQLEVMKVLIEQGADVNQLMEIEAQVQFEKSPATALGVAAALDKSAAAQLLVQHGALIDAVGYRGLTPLANAVLEGHNGLAMWLVQEGADVNALNGDNETALIAAVMGANAEMTAFLLEKGANKSVRNAAGHTALHYAEEYELDEIAKLLK
jgi:uncharacterized protein